MKKEKCINITRWIFFLICLWGWVGCTREKPKEIAPVSSADIPILEFPDSVVVHMYDKSHLIWELKTKYLSKTQNNNHLFAKPLSIDFFDSTGVLSAKVRSDSGSADEEITFVSVWGDVYAENNEGLVVEADSMIWQKRTKQIKTDGWVKVVTENQDTLTGIGFVSDDQLNNWKILSNIRTVIQKVDERVQEEGEAE